MQRWIPLLALLLALQLGLAVWLDRRDDRLAPPAADAKLVAADLAPADRIRIEGPLEPPAAGASQPAAKGTPPALELIRRDGRWRLPALHDAPADAGKLERVLAALREAPRGLPDATSQAALERFAVDAKRFERRLEFRAGERVLATVYLGDSAGPRRSHVRTAGQNAVYTIALASYELPTAVDDWLDRAMLAPAVDRLASVRIERPDAPPLTIRRAAAAAAGAPASAASIAAAASVASAGSAGSVGAPPVWQADDAPPGQKLDAARAAAFVAQLGELRIDQLLGVGADPAWPLDRPALALTLADRSGQTTLWKLAPLPAPAPGASQAAPSGDYVLEVTGHPWFARIGAAGARALLDAAAPARLLAGAGPTSTAGAQAP